MLDDKSWLEVEMDETITLLRKKLEEMNNEHPNNLTSHDIECFKNLYKTIYYIKMIRATMK